MSYIKREVAEELLSQPIIMSTCLTREECLAKRSQRDRDVALLHSIPAADVRPVVTCRDCDCWNVWDRVRDTCSCGFWSEDRLIYTKEKDFCSWGRKRGVDE